jgi:hypothetical protein
VGHVTPISLTAYAKRRGVSPVAVSKAVARGRLNDSVVRDERGAPKISDPDLADQEWEQNTRQRADRPGQTVRPSRLPDPPLLEEMPGAAATYPPTAAPRGRRADPLPDGVPAYHASQAIRAHHEARRSAAAADQAELELAARRGKLVDVAEITGEFNAHITNAKARLLALPTHVGQELPDLAERVVPVVDRLIRAALQELAADGRRA